MPSDSDDLQYIEKYAGSHNPISIEFTHRAKFSCKFVNYQNYPFESNSCQFKTYLLEPDNNLTKLVGELEDSGPTSLGQYNTKWTFKNGVYIYSES